MNLIKLEEIVKTILEKDVKARDDDMYLYYCYLQTLYDNNITSDAFKLIFTRNDLRSLKGIKSFCSVERCRRKLQSKYEYLRPSGKIKKERTKAIKDYVDYALFMGD